MTRPPRDRRLRAMGHPAEKLDPSPYPVDLSDLTPRMRRGLEREGISLDELRAFRAGLTPDQERQMLAYEASMARMGLERDEIYDPSPMTDEEKADLLADAATWATPEQMERFRRDLAR